VSRPLWFVGADGSVASRALGVLRLSLLALAIGQGLVANAFATASLLPYLISLVVTGGILGSTLLPQLLPQFVTSDREDPASDADKTDDKTDDVQVAPVDEAGSTAPAPNGGANDAAPSLRFVQRLGTRLDIDRGLAIILVGLLLLTIVCIVGASTLVRGLGSGLTGSLGDLTASFAAVTLVQVFLYGVCAVFGRVLAARRRLGALGWAPAIGELVGIGGLLAFMRLFQGHVSSAEWTPEMVWWLAGAATAGIAVQALVLAFAVWRSGPGTATLVAAWSVSRLFGGRSVTALVTVASYAVAAQVMWRATGYDEVSRGPGQTFVAGLASLVNALVVVLLPHALLTRPALGSVHQRVAAALQADDRAAAGRRFASGLAVPAVVTIPGSIALLVFALPIMGLLFTSKDPAEVLAGSTVLACLGPALFPMGIALLGRRVCEAVGAHWSAGALTAVLALTSIGVSVGAGFAAPEWATPLVALGLVLGNTLAAAYGVWVVRRRIGTVALAGVVRTWVRILLAGAGGGYVAWGLVMVLTRALGGLGRLGYALTLLIGGTAFIVVYLLVARLLRVDEVSVVAAPLVNRLDHRPPGRHRPGD